MIDYAKLFSANPHTEYSYFGSKYIFIFFRIFNKYDALCFIKSFK